MEVKKYYLKAYNPNTGRSVEAENIIIDSVFEQLEYVSGRQWTVEEGNEICRQLAMEWDLDITHEGTSFKLCYQFLMDNE